MLAILDLSAAVNLMKFTLTFDGEMPATGNSSRKCAAKWQIRKAFHPQLKRGSAESILSLAR